MRSIIISIVAALCGCAVAAAAEIDFEGEWMRGDGNALVGIAPCGANICATNLWIGDTSRGEAVGDQLVMSLTRESTNTYAGTAYDPKRKLSYSIILTAGRGRLTTRGCFVGRLICREVSWIAAK